jgi:hypothetical protein
VAQITDYQSLTQAIADFTHRADLANGLYTDYFLQVAQNKIANDIFKENMGNGIAAMEVAMPPQQINGGTAVVPSDWFSPKAFQVSDGDSDTFPLLFKAVSWLYGAYPIRQPEGLPAYMARDVMAPASFTGALAGGVLTASAVTGTIQTGMPIDDTSGLIVNPCTITGGITGTGGAGTYSVSTAQTLYAEAMTGGGNVFVFGPYPDSSYTIQGTYYSKGTVLCAANTTNWMVLQAPEVIHAYSMIEAGKFLKDTAMVEQWSAFAADFLASLIERDKGERWASSTMQIETA